MFGNPVPGLLKMNNLYYVSDMNVGDLWLVKVI